jgi:LPS export ABC transporter protein LptC
MRFPRSLWILLLVTILYLYGCEEKIKPSVLSTVDSQTLPQQESWNSTIVISDSGRITAIIVAGYFRMSQGVKVRFFNTEGKQTSVLTSKEGSVDEATNNLEAYKDVVVVSNDSSKLRTERLFWDDQRQLIWTPEYVEITTLKEKLKGHGFESDQGLNKYRIFRVTGETRAE